MTSSPRLPSLDVKPKDLTKALERKSKLLAEAEKLYVSIADFKDPKWATAALFRYGQIYDAFAEALVKAAETPPPNVPKELHEAVLTRAEAEDRTMAQTIRVALRYYLQETKPLAGT